MEGTEAALVRLSASAAAAAGALCLDGSPGAFYYRAGTRRLLVYLEGGGECRTAEECAGWRGGSGPSSAAFPPSRALRHGELSTDPLVNPLTHDWAKLILPYCSADMHSGTRTSPSVSLGGAFFGGHNIIVASLRALRELPSYTPPSFVLVTGSSAGGIGALLHADFFSAQWPQATVKVSPSAGFFYAGGVLPLDCRAVGALLARLASLRWGMPSRGTQLMSGIPIWPIRRLFPARLALQHFHTGILPWLP